jgi:hypothetical protein
MKKVKYALFAVLFAIPISIFAQSLQANSEEALMQKWNDLQSECAKISKMVPCAVGVADVDKLPAADAKSERDARVKLALSVKAFVSYDAVDSSWIENEVAQELSKAASRVKIEDLALANSQVLKKEYAKITENGKTFHRVITLIVLNPQLYAEAESEVKKFESSSEAASSSSSESMSVQAQNLKQNTQPVPKLPVKTTFKEIATKTATVLLGIAKKWVGL